MRRFLAAFLALLLVLLFTLKMKLFLGWAPDFPFVLLVVFGFVLGFYETLILTVLAAWIMNWRVFPGLELWIMAATALLAYFGRYFMPFERWLSFTILAAGGIALMYFVASPQLFLAEWKFLGLDILGSTLFGFAMLKMFRSFSRIN